MKTPTLLKLSKAGKSAGAIALIQAGADVNMRTPKGKTTRDLALLTGNSQLMHPLNMLL